MSAAIISQGDEILSGQVPDTNFPFLARKLAKIGIAVQTHLVLGDSPGRLAQAIKSLSASSGLVLLTGGLGPTADDITRYALSEALASPLQLDQPALEQIEQHFARLKRPMSPVNRVQAMIPATARTIENPWGTAPGIAAKLGQTHIFALPGVPHEMRAMFSDRIEPELRRLGLAESAIVSRSLHCCGAGESDIFSLIKDLMARPENPQVGITAKDGVITVGITARADSPAAALELLDEKSRRICSRLGQFLFGRDQQTLAQVLGELLVRKNQSLALAESCTGGLIGKLLTDVPGASKFLLADLVTYANQAKIQLLGVPEKILEKHGAVSADCARAMAAGAIARTGADWALAVTGIAGPDGGTSEKPVGLIFIALARKDSSGKPVDIDVQECRFTGDRQHIRLRASHAALDCLRRALLGGR